MPVEKKTPPAHHCWAALLGRRITAAAAPRLPLSSPSVALPPHLSTQAPQPQALSPPRSSRRGWCPSNLRKATAHPSTAEAGCPLGRSPRRSTLAIEALVEAPVARPTVEGHPRRQEDCLAHSGNQQPLPLARQTRRCPRTACCMSSARPLPSTSHTARNCAWRR